ncbi:MAG: DUF1343 domain-containing protein [Armatimonadetes bacterium]|nr:DUF1343 domain-containing protein [Armatimonadota bacterium]
MIATAIAALLLAPATVKTGLDVWRDEQFVSLMGRVGLITNPTGVDSGLSTNLDLMLEAGVNVTALYGPEHGVRGGTPAGVKIENATDPETGIPEFSLYGSTRRPTAAMLKNVDVLVFDIQDIGSRSYTYIATLGACMESAAEFKKPIYVIDRPNPIGGDRIEGNIAEPAYQSFVSPYAIPYCHGLTIGELAQMIKGEKWNRAGAADLHIVKMKGWRRSMSWAETGLPWVATSPHIPHPATAAFYAATGIIGELQSVSIGVGYTSPFELVGAPKLSARTLAKDLTAQNLSGITFRSTWWTPYYAAFKGESCAGVQVHITDEGKAPLTRVNFELMDAIRKQQPDFDFFVGGRADMFDKVCGTASIRKGFLAGKSAATMWSEWNTGADNFRKSRKKYLLY